ncbi:MAG: ATP-dependent nuclease [Limisphaerales bacterium]
MNLSSFSVENYRSIATAQHLPTDARVTTLIGPNNEGKSNILRALVAALQAVPRFARTMPPGRTEPVQPTEEWVKSPARMVFRDGYEWERDFPVALQDANEDGQTIFILEFALTKRARASFASSTGSNLHGKLVFEIRVGSHGAELKATDSNGGGHIPRQLLRKACRFMGANFNCQYIPAIRTAGSAQEIVEGIVERELAALEEKRVYRTALAQIAKIQKPVLREISKSVTATLREFLPSVKNVKLAVSAEQRSQALRRACSIMVDDGTETNLREKGDGVQSLAALSLMRHAALLSSKGKNILLAVEEPETHLHSKALHQLRAVIQEIASNHQVVLTTHNPIFVSRGNISTNIIVTSNKATPATSLEEIRETLGVRPADNLRYAEVVLVVEGEDDRIALGALLSHESKQIKQALEDGILGIDPLHGSSNLSYKLSTLRTAMCSTVVFVDHDRAGKDAVEKAIADGVLTRADCKFALFRGKDESELEDFYSTKAYEAALSKHFSVTLPKPLIRGRKKWSDRVSSCFTASAQVWDDTTKAATKARVAEAVAANPKAALSASARAPFKALVQLLEDRLSAKITDKSK